MSMIPPWEPPMAGTADEHLLAMLDRLRVTFRYKTEGLNITQLAFKIPTSNLSLGGLLQHLAVVEDEKFTFLINRQRPEILVELTGEGENHFEVDPTTDADVLYRRYDRLVATNRAVQQQCLVEQRLDESVDIELDGKAASVRRVLSDLVEEYGRHTGHADLLREAIDGRVGEDPPGDYLPAWYEQPNG